MDLVILYWCAQGGYEIATTPSAIFFFQEALIALHFYVTGATLCVGRCSNAHQCFCPAISRWLKWNWRGSPNAAFATATDMALNWKNVMQH